MSNDANGETISRAEYERLRAEHDFTLQKNSQLVGERVEISRQMDQLNAANSQLRKEIDRFESQVRDTSRNRKAVDRDPLENCVCENCLTHLETIQALQRELRENLETSSEKYDRVVDHYDNVLRGHAADLQDLQAQNSELQEENSNLTKILRNTVGGSQKATPEQIQNFRRVSRVSAISGPASVPRDIDKDQLIAQLTNELNRSNAENASLDNSLSELTANNRSQIEYLENQIEQHEQEKNDIVAQIQAKLEDREFLRAIFEQRKTEDPLFFKQLISEGRRTSHDMESEEDLEFRLRQKCDEVRVLERELQDADEHRQTLERQLEKEHSENKELSQKSSQFQYAKDSLDQIVKEYCSGGLFPRKPETFLFIDEKLTALVNTLYGNFTMIKSLNEEVKWYESEREKQNEDQTSVRIENLEKLVASQKDQIGEQFKDKIKDKCKIRDLEDDLRNKEEEYEEMGQQMQTLQQDKEKYKERLDETDMRFADLEDEFHQYKREVEDERRSQKGSKLKNLQLHSQVWILKNRVSKCEKQRDEVSKNNELLREELQMARDKLEAVNLQMADQERTARRVSTILKPGGNLTGKDAIIKDLKDQLTRQKSYNDKLEKKLDDKQEKLRGLEDKIKDITVDRDAAKDELQRSFSRMDSEDFDFQDSSSSSGPLSMDLLMMDSKQRHISVDYTIQEEEVHEQFNEAVRENEELKSELEEIKSKLKRIKAELDRERLYVENFDRNYEMQLLKNAELQQKLDDQNRSNVSSSLPVIQESFEESLYDGTLTKEQVNELLEKLNVLQEELGKEKVYVQHLEDQNEQFRIDLCSVSSVEKLSGDEKEDLIGKYSEMEERLNQRLKELEEAQKTIDDLLKRIHEYQKSELQYQDDIDNVSEQLEQSLNDVVEHESLVAALTSEKTELEAQVREIKDENCRLVDKNIALQEELITVKEGRDAETTEKLKEKDDLIEDANKNMSKWKNDCEESERNLRAVTSQFEGARQELLQSKSKVESLTNELEKAEETIEKKVKECSEVLLEMEELKVEAQKVQGILDEVTAKEQQSALAVRELEDQVKTLIIEKEESDLLLKEKEENLTVMMKKMEESDVDTVELRQQLEELAAVEAVVKEKDECIAILNDQVKQLTETIEKEQVMNNKNRDLMDEMQREVREARIERKMARSMQVESEASIKNIQKQCDEKVRMERLMNDKNRDVMNGMQAEVRKCRADRAKAESALSEATATIKILEGEIEKANFELEELKESKEVANLQSAMNAVQDAMQEMELRDAELMKTLEEKVENNLAIQNELASLQKKLDDSDNRYNSALEEKETTISALESALSEEMIRGDQLEKKLEPFANRQFNDNSCQFETETKDCDCQSAVVELSEFGNQAASEIIEAAAQTNMTVEVLDKLQEKVEILEEQIEKMTEESGYSCNQLVEIREELIAEQERFKSTVSTYEALVESKQAQIDVLEKDAVELASLQVELTQQLKSTQEENARVKLEGQKVSSQLSNMKQENQKLTTANNALQTELDIQLEARNEIDNVIEDKEKEFLEVADKYNMEKIEKDAAKETIVILEEEKQQLENYLLETKKKLEDEVEQSKIYQDEATETINSLNNELRRRLLEQSYAHVLSSDSENDDHISTLPRPLRKSADFKDALEETKLSVRALAKANQKLGHQIDKLLTEKDNFLIKSKEESKEIGVMKSKLNEAILEKNKFETAAKQLEIELMEREVSMENLEENVVYLKRELENQKIERLKKSPLTQGTLTDLHNLKHKCFMVIPSDPAREILHMFVSQYRENLCSNCYARITTLGSRPCTPRKSPVATPRKSAGSTSDIVVQTDSSLFTYGTDSAYSSSVSIQTEQPSNQSVERLKMKNQQLSNDLADRKKSEKELELALQYQLKIAGELQKKVGKLEKREKGLIEQIAGYKERENNAEKKEIQYEQLLERYKAVKEELMASAENAEKLELELKKRQNCSLPRSSTPDDSATPPHSECSQLYLSPITNRTSDTKLLCDRQCDTMSPLIITWADSETQTGRGEEEEEEEDEGLEYRFLRDIQLCTQQLCHTLKLEDDTLPTLTAAVIHRLEQLKEEKEVLEQETQKEMNRLQEELMAAKDQISKSEDSALDIEEELKRVLDFQEKERVEMQNKVKNFATQLQTELKKARDDKKFAEDALNKSIEKISEESNFLNDQHEQSLVSMKEERDGLERKLEEIMNKAKEEREGLMKERNDLERQFFDYKIKSVSEKETLIESQTNNLALLEKLKSDYQQKEDQVNAIQTQCNKTIENLRSQIGDLEVKNKEKAFEIERLKNKIHQYTNREVDATEKLTQSQKIIDALKRDVLETRARLENLAGYEVKCGDTETENVALRSQVENLETTKLTLLEEARELKEAIEHARDTLNYRVELDSYKNPALAAVAALWMQEREEVNDTKDALQATEWELQELKSEARKFVDNRAEIEQLKKQIFLVEEERAMMKTKLSEFQERQIEAENTAESVKEELNSSQNQLQVLLSDKEELQTLLARHTQEKDRLLEDLNQSFKQKNDKEVRLESCLAELSSTQDQLFAVKEELVRNRSEAEKLRESLQRARTELDDLDKNIGQIKGERDTLAASQPKMRSLEKKIGDLELLNKSLSRRLAVASEERQRAEEEATGVTDKLERDVAEILEAFEEYKERTGTAPEKVQELKHGMAALQETLHQIMNTNSELSKEKIRLNQELEKLKQENSNLSYERNEFKHQLDNSLIDLSKDGEVSDELIAHNQMLQAQLDSLSQRSSRLDKLEHDNTILKNKVRKMREMLREKEDQLINLNESYEMKEELEKENAHFKKMVTSLKQKLDKSKEANVMLKDKVRDLEESRDQFMASTPNHSRGNRSIMDVSDELEPIRSDSDPRRLAVESRTSIPSLASQSRVSMATSQMSSFETISLAERCKTLDIELKDLKERYKILQETHESEQNKAHEMSDALRNSVRILKNYIDRSGDVKGERMSELQDQLELQRSQLFSMADQLGVDLAQSSIHLADRESLASVSTVCIDGADNQLI
ncbi:hypothetical protein ACHWQZ_G015689 [Mnemiopsis leidyi]